MKLAMISGSLRRGSANTVALREAERHIRSQYPDVAVHHCRIDDLDFFNEDVEAAGWPTKVERLRHQIDSVDAVLISTPAYNGAVPGALKNALDWLSRPDSDSPLLRKPVATMSASPFSFGAVWAQENLRFILEQSQARIINEDLVALAHVFSSIDENGEFLAGNAAHAVRRLADEIVAFGRRALDPAELVVTSGDPS